MAQSAGNHHRLVSSLFNCLDLVLHHGAGFHHGVVVILRPPSMNCVVWVGINIIYRTNLTDILYFWFERSLEQNNCYTVDPRSVDCFPHTNSRRPRPMMTPLPPSTPSKSPGLQHDGGVRRPALHGYGPGWENPWVGRLS